MLRVCCLAAAVLGGGAATAAPEKTIRTVVVTVPEGEPALPLQRLVEALRSQLLELGVWVQLSAGPAGGGDNEAMPQARDRDVLAFVWVERTENALTVHFYEPAGASLRERRIPVTGTDAASIEEVAVVVRSAVDALLERAAHERPATPEPEPRPAPESTARVAAIPPRPDQPEPSPLQAAVAYTATRYASEVPWQHGVLMSLAWRPAATPWRVGAECSWFPSLTRRTNDLTLTLDRHPIGVFLGYELPVAGSGVTLRAEGSGIADPIVRRTSRLSADLNGTPPSVRWSWAVSTRLRVGWQPSTPFWVFATGGADFLLNRFDHVVQNGSETPVLSPLRVRPHLQVGASVDFP